eukprot:10576272-Alexandrium_andersonii.AAC.1
MCATDAARRTLAPGIRRSSPRGVAARSARRHCLASLRSAGTAVLRRATSRCCATRDVTVVLVGPKVHRRSAAR